MSSKVEQLRAQLNERILVLDGGMGTMLQAAGLKLGARPEELNIIVGVDGSDFERAIRVLYNSFVK